MFPWLHASEFRELLGRMTLDAGRFESKLKMIFHLGGSSVGDSGATFSSLMAKLRMEARIRLAPGGVRFTLAVTGVLGLDNRIRWERSTHGSWRLFADNKGAVNLWPTPAMTRFQQ